MKYRNIPKPRLDLKMQVVKESGEWSAAPRHIKHHSIILCVRSVMPTIALKYRSFADPNFQEGLDAGEALCSDCFNMSPR